LTTPRSSDPEFRAVLPHEYGEVMALWLAVWGEDGEPYFRAYLEGDPWFRDRYCRVARADGRIVSAAVVCRRPIRHGGIELTMGGIANVATLKEYRKHGYSSELLGQCVEVMEVDGFDFSALGTGTHRHYERQGWFRVGTPGWELALRDGEAFPPADPDVSTLSLEQWLAEAPPVYAAFNAGFPLCFERSLDYWNGWIRIRATAWHPERTVVLGLWRDGALEGYLLGSLPDRPDGSFRVHEVAAIQPAELPRLLTSAIRAALTGGVMRLSLQVPPYPLLSEALSQWGELKPETHDHAMLRRIHADEATMADIVRSYETGMPPWWGLDDY
jgi:predicted acetyltransferase